MEQRIEKFFQRLFDKFGTYNYKVYLTGKGNFREQVAVSHVYKGNRKKEKPRWYKHIKDYLYYMHRTELVEGMEADDGMAMNLVRNPNSILCSIDKDLLQVPGWHYSWATHNREELPLRKVDSWGKLEIQGKKLYGEGTMFLYAQALLGDSTDNIIGAKGYGPVKTYNTLKDCKTEKELYDAVYEVYFQEILEDDPNYQPEDVGKVEERLHENMNLLYMIRELDEGGKPVMWRKPE